MSQHHRSWKPPTAAKPSHLASVSASKSPTSLAALQGATTAFIANPKTTSSTVKQLRNQYEPAHADISFKDKRGRSHEEPKATVHDAPVRRSPSRGRHLSPEHPQSAGARSAVSGTSLPVPGSLDRTPSTIAARLASASSSPVRSSAGASPPTVLKTSNGSLGRSLGNNGATNHHTKPALLASNPSQYGPTPKPTPVQGLSPDKVPRLPPKSIPVLPRTSGERHGTSPNTGSLPVPTALTRSNSQASDSVTTGQATPSHDLPRKTDRLKPPTPAPRKGRPVSRSPLQPNLTGPKQHQGLSREETISRMADAMVASSLASTRTSSPTKTLQGHASTRRSASAHNLRRIPSSEQRKLPVHHKPPRPMKHTLRKPSPDDEDEGLDTTKRGRRHLVRKHPNMHREGDRKRWRDKITEMERKRYEGVFAANRGLLLRSADPAASPSRLVDPASESNQVVNVVVRDIWERSRLPEQVLEQIYDLVAPDDALVLSREQFVVGLWLIDQKLKGRKLPVRVSESVWSSVRHSQGIKVGRRA